eukprot:PLAT8472.1.p1 GENE.PLAT8472.1~~PLAT8472.1.p1  ORF type:complete len:552 (-),score=215.64 PLAT8472.1:106-1761(-)
MNADAITELCEATPKPDGIRFKYGTAGFRTKADILHSTMLRVGFLAALRSQLTGVEVGVMITASHNAACDNGVKLVDGDGGMLAQEWEPLCAALANAEGAAEVIGLLKKIAADESSGEGELPQARVHIGRDTREHSEELAALVAAGVERGFSGVVLQHGVVTTPQLHHFVRFSNLGQPEVATEEGYYRMFADAYAELTADADAEAAAARGPLLLDCAYGVGALKVAPLVEALGGAVDIIVRNGVGEGELNAGCGAEHVQKRRLPPAGADEESDGGKRLASLDGDADRLVYYYFHSDKGFRLLDGDKIATLASIFVQEQLALIGEAAGEIAVGVVQTAYANGASTHYIRTVLGLDAPWVKTGVKHLHHKAVTFDIGVYFEANGHGTIVFKPELLARLQAVVDGEDSSDDARRGAAALLAASRLINQAVGDALSDALFVEAMLTRRGWTLSDWDDIYDDLPSRQGKLRVADRSVVVTVEDETATVAPAELQPAIDAVVAEYERGRAFVRPSGTEDVVRVYAEATTQEAADELALRVARAAHEHAGGVGDAPDW